MAFTTFVYVEIEHTEIVVNFIPQLSEATGVGYSDATFTDAVLSGGQIHHGSPTQELECGSPKVLHHCFSDDIN